MASFVLFLSTEGNSVRIENFSQNGATLPEQAKALACKTHQEVLLFLEKLKNSETKDRIEFSHDNNYFYDKHAGLGKGYIHSCTLEDQMEFIRFKMSEASQRVRRPAPRTYCVLV